MSTNYPPPPPPGGADDRGEHPSYGATDGAQGVPLPPPPDGGYGSAPPPEGAYGQAPVAVARPPAMNNAVRLMQAGGVVALISLIVLLFSKSTIHDAVVKANEKSTGTRLTASQIDTAVNASIAVGVVLGLIGAALWFWMAMVNGKGRSWGRIVATVFFVLSALSTIYGFASAGAPLSKLLGALQFLIGAAAIFFMYRKESSEFYRGSSAPRR